MFKSHENIVSLAMSKKMGGGSGGVSSWNDLTDKPFGMEVVDGGIHRPKLTISDGWSIQFEDHMKLVPGETYTVWIDGVEYVTKAVQDEYGGVYIGSESLWMNSGYVETELPFCYGDGWYAMPQDGTYNFQISGPEYSIVKMEPKYLPYTDLYAKKVGTLNPLYSDKDCLNGAYPGYETDLNCFVKIHVEITDLDTDGSEEVVVIPSSIDIVLDEYGDPVTVVYYAVYQDSFVSFFMGDEPSSSGGGPS